MIESIYAAPHTPARRPIWKDGFRHAPRGPPRHWPGLAEKLVRTERSLQVRAGGITETYHRTQDQDHDCNYIHSIEIPIEPSGLVGELSSSAAQ